MFNESSCGCIYSWRLGFVRRCKGNSRANDGESAVRHNKAVVDVLYPANGESVFGWTGR